ncbi:Reversal of tor2 lethality [Marasmius tenuissimus]|uniref:Reversal of tor2 lethality n=1 Tax=Marasmius tenuissimus TaxID=585030 RepID=A0ABR2ZT79_9AGAR|nr:Reversal of tor2 lethality [Marasmius tenuissimus]
MIFNLTPLAALVFATLASAQSQTPIVYDAIHNATTIVGSWSSGSRAVKTGAEFANPSNKSFTYPKVTGEAYAFTDDGWFEISRYRMVSNGAEPNCITAVMYWTHGKYTLEPNGTITTIANGDGYQQVQDPCAPVSNLIEPINNNEPFTQWRIFQDTSQGYKLHLWKYDGNPVAPLFQVSTQPIMLPKEQLRNDPAAPAGTGSTRRKRSLLSVVKRSNAATGDSAATRWTVMSVGASVLFALGSSMI